MGTAKVSNSSSEDQNVSSYSETDVILNVYDLTPLNNYSYWVGFGIFHSGIEVHGKEYGFGAHDFPVSGVFEVEPKSCPGFIYRSSILLGRINMPYSEFREFIENVASEYHGDTYHLISKNCNHFTDDMAQRLIGRHIPGWVNRMARLGTLILPIVYQILYMDTHFVYTHYMSLPYFYLSFQELSVTLDDINALLFLKSCCSF
ncbi:hypothetical protein Goari_015375 [Gossypium aridum]|uniref:PPPDE domain-containing protein n=1 Tax=Gossypium aridum TaxID=34290 RepID=A0A7J8WFD0_GOSAI|nr:hypothetical protein [Gossypium aridum]